MLGDFCPPWAHQSPDHILHSNARRAMNRFESAASTCTLQRFLSIPRSRVFWKPNCRLITRNECSTLARMGALAVSTRSSIRPSGVSGSARRLPGRIATRSPMPRPSQGLLEVCPSRPGSVVVPAVSCAGTAPAPWPPSPPPTLLPQAICSAFSSRCRTAGCAGASVSPSGGCCWWRSSRF